jgi:DNA-binding MarR family transcriptional regulator
MSGIAINVIDASSVASNTPSVVFESAIHLYRSSAVRVRAVALGALTTVVDTPSIIQANCTVYLSSIVRRVTSGSDLGQLSTELRVVLGQLIRRLRAESRFPLTQGSVLGRLDREGTSSIGALATAERVRPQSMAQTVADLEGAGLISRRPDPADGRRTLVELTGEGRRALAEFRRDREGWLASAIAAELTAGERRRLEQAIELLRRLAES